MGVLYVNPVHQGLFDELSFERIVADPACSFYVAKDGEGRALTLPPGLMRIAKN